MGNQLLGARQETREQELEVELARLRSRLSIAERGWRKEYEWRRNMENFIRSNAVTYMSITKIETFHRQLLSRIPLNPRKKFGRR